MAKKIYYSKDRYGNNRYDTPLTQKDRIKMRDCKNRHRPLTREEKFEIFGDENPTFIRRA